jgi:hypothetical protein
MTPAIVPYSVPRGLAAISPNVPALFVPNAKTAERLFEFFTATWPTGARYVGDPRRTCLRYLALRPNG